MKMIQGSLAAKLKILLSVILTQNNQSFMKSQNIKIGTLFENYGDWMVELPKGTASQFVEHCRAAGVGFTLITGVYSGLFSARRDLVLFDYEFNAEELQKLVDTFLARGRNNVAEERLFACHASR
ncbi:MAG: hypothetical protein WDN00_10985 [Limisphaerales bacterium]